VDKDWNYKERLFVMPSSVFSSLFSTLDPRTIGEIASRFGQPKQAVSQGLESSTACLLAGLANKASDSSWMSQLFKLVSQAPSNVNVSDLTGAVTDPSNGSSVTSSLLDSGKNFLSLAFGGNQSSIADAVGRSTGLRAGVVSSLMSMAAPLLMTALGRLVRDDHMNPAGLSRLLVHEGEGVRDLLPAGVSNLLNAMPPPAPTVTPNTRPVALGTIKESEPAVRSRGWWWLIPVLLLIPLLLWVSRVRHPVVPNLTDVNGFVARTLPGNVSLNIPQNGIEAWLLAFIQDPSKGVEPATWFDFDRLLFNTDSATLRPESQEQMRNIAAILKAYPNVHIKIGGYTDNSGDAQNNLNLSKDRANGVMAELIALGISPDRLEAQGYGEQFPVADNATAEGRARNRRVSMRVTQK
jgi:outer membrane protein OmpA-like peptidoglycan-associated protein